LIAALAEGLLSLHVGATLPLAEAATALRTAVDGGASGATVLTLQQSRKNSQSDERTSPAVWQPPFS
jgi:hypothetical protein